MKRSVCCTVDRDGEQMTKTICKSVSPVLHPHNYTQLSQNTRGGENEGEGERLEVCEKKNETKQKRVHQPERE